VSRSFRRCAGIGRAVRWTRDDMLALTLQRIHKIYPSLPTSGVNSREIPSLEGSIRRRTLGCPARLSAGAAMLRESWSGLVSVVVRDLSAAFRRLIPVA